jgi:hypothetical protein
MKFANKIIISDIWIRQIGKVAYEIRQKNNYFSYTDSPIGEIRGEIRQLAKLLLAKTGIGDGILHQMSTP